MNYTLRILFFIGILLFSSCSSQKILQQYSGTRIVFGNGGGFTRQSNEYILNTEGELIHIKGIEKDTVRLTPLKKKITAGIYERLAQLGLDTMHFNHPGDRYYFVKEIKGDTIDKVAWGDPSFTIPSKIEEFYQLLMSNINN